MPNAARLFVDQSLADDRVAVVSFSTNAAVNYPTTQVPTLGPTAVLDAAKAAINGLTPDGMTAIGKGLLEGQGEVTVAPADYFLGNQPTGVQVFGYPDAQAQYADLIMEDGRYLLWGFDKGPKSMTDDGRKLLVNAVYRTMQ